MILSLAGALLGCSTTDISTGSINRSLVAGGEDLARNERNFERERVRHLGGSLPICVAYRMPPSGQPLTKVFEQTLEDLSRFRRNLPDPPTRAVVHHAQKHGDTSGAFPSDVLLALKSALQRPFPTAAMSYQPVAFNHFLDSAVCRGKDTVFVDLERVSFYRTRVPTTLAWSGDVKKRDLLFIELSTGGKLASVPN